MTQLTPMLKQYMDIKENTNDALVFYRLGDFYELFFDDAIVASKALDLVLTARAAGQNQKAPMCGVPHHAAKSYIQKLINQGFKVAIVEQVEDPKDAKGIVKREVVEIITPGTYLDAEENQTREIAALTFDLIYATLVICNLVDGEVRALRVMNDVSEIVKTLWQFQVKEIVVDDTADAAVIAEIKGKSAVFVSYEREIDPEIKHKDAAVQKTLGRLTRYLQYTHKKTLTHLRPVVLLNDQAYLRMDYATMTNLELINHQSDQGLSLYRFINRTQTNMGARLLKEWIMRPLVDADQIKNRQDQVAALIKEFVLSDLLRDLLKDTYDIHRVLARLSTGKHTAHDLLRLKKTLHAFSRIKNESKGHPFLAIVNDCDDLGPVSQALDEAIYDTAPLLLKEGKTFKPGIDSELDELNELNRNGKRWLIEYENQQREITGIKNLKVGYTRAFGYYIEISKGQIDNVKESFGYVRKQTLTNAERYISEALQEYEVNVAQAADRVLEIEQELFARYTAFVEGYAAAIKAVADVLAQLDVLLSLSEVSALPGYTRPIIDEGSDVSITEGKHPVLQAALTSHQYISSDVLMSETRRVLVLTGPNMGGKSTYMRMVALNIILAQMGCFIPCSQATLAVVDQIFTRMGASDDILMGQSTFMIEMTEAQLALSKATRRSLILFDEIGRGTSTYDGMALAQAIIEYITNVIQCKTIFSTHYHELVSLESMYAGIQNINVEVHEEDDTVVFMYRVIDGKADKSYGINVARLAHLPKTIIDRAQQNLITLELKRQPIDLEQKILTIETEPRGYIQAKQRLDRVDINHVTPMEALTLLAEIKAILGDDDE